MIWVKSVFTFREVQILKQPHIHTHRHADIHRTPKTEVRSLSKDCRMCCHFHSTTWTEERINELLVSYTALGLLCGTIGFFSLRNALPEPSRAKAEYLI